MSSRIHRAALLLLGSVLACWPALVTAQDAPFEKIIRSATKAQQQGRDAEAERLYLSAVQEAEKLGPENPRLAVALNNLGMLYEHEGQLAKAEQLLNRAFAIDEKVFGPDHPRVANDLNSRAVFYRASGQEAEAENLLKRALEIQERLPADEHPQLLVPLNNLAAIYPSPKKVRRGRAPLRASLADNLPSKSELENQVSEEIGKSNLRYHVDELKMDPLLGHNHQELAEQD